MGQDPKQQLEKRYNMEQIKFNINGKSYTWKALNRLSKAQLLAEAQKMGSSVDSLTAWTKASLADYLIDLADRKASAPADEKDNVFFYEYTEEDLGCNERVIADYYPDFGVVSVSAIEENEAGLWYYYADIEADMFSVCDKTRFMQLLLDNTDKGCSCGTYKSLREILEENAKDNPMLYFFRPSSWAYQLKQMSARGC